MSNMLKNPFLLAPMAGITDCAFRSFMKEMGCGPVITELVSANGLEYSSERTKALMKFEPIQSPIGIQLFGEEPEIIARGASLAEEMGCDFVDLNFGCPVPKVVKKGAGAATLRDPIRLAKILSTVKAAIKIPLTIKIRTGWDDNSRNAHEVVSIAFNEGIHWVSIHGRTRAQGYSGQSDWDYIGEVKSSAKLPIIGNGDIHTAQQAVDHLSKYKVDGVMIGRGCLKNPWIFKEAQSLLRGEKTTIDKNFEEVFRKLYEHLVKHAEEKVILIQVKKFAAWYSSGYPGASQFRKNLFAAKSLEEVLSVISHYFETLKETLQADTSGEAFLMGGHG